MQKKILFILSAIMILLRITEIFAAAPAPAPISADAKTCKVLGFISNGDKDVTVEYMNKELTKLTAAVVILKLRGIYDDAKAFKGVENFADAKDCTSEEDKAIMAYLKANPQLGFKGDEKDNFNPSAPVNEQFYYKLLLEALGYTQTTKEVAGDFVGEDTLAFAEVVGLKPAKPAKVTINNLASAVVQALKANTKDGRVYINTLVTAGKLTAEQVKAAGVPAAKLASAKAIDNNLVKVVFNQAVDRDFAQNLSNYAVNDLKIKSAKPMANGTKTVIVEVSSQTPGELYTLTIGDAKADFTGMARLGDVPQLKRVDEDDDTKQVKLTFDKMLDTDSALDKSNYSIDNTSIEAIKISKDNTVFLTVKGLQAGRSYKVKVSNIKSVDGSMLKSASMKLLSSADASPPRIKSVDSNTNTRVTIKFNEDVLKDSAVNVKNYVVTSASGPLVIKSARCYEDKVELTTEPQKSVRYEISISNIADNKALPNKMTESYKTSFIGTNANRNTSKVIGFDYIARNTVQVKFKADCRIDRTTATNVKNYSFNEGIVVKAVKTTPVDGDSNDFTSVLLTVSELSADKSYKLKVQGVKDEYGAEIEGTHIGSKRVALDALESTKVINVKSIIDKKLEKSFSKIEIRFTKYLDAASAAKVANYIIDGDIGHPLEASYDAAVKKVTLTVPRLTAGKSYKVTLTNLSDIGGNIVDGKELAFVGIVEEDDELSPELEYIEVLNRNVVRAVFNQPIGNIGDAVMELKASEGRGNTDGKTITLISRVGYENDKIVEFSDYPNIKLNDTEYTIVGLNVRNKAGKRLELSEADDDNLIFDGTSQEPEGAELLSINQVNSKKIELSFDEKVMEIYKGNLSQSEENNGFSASIDEDDESKAYLISSKAFKSGKKYEADLGKLFVNKHGIRVENLDDKEITEITASDDTEAPYIDNIKAVNTNNIELTFNEDIEKAGAYEIEYEDSDKGDDKKVILRTDVKSIEDNIVKLTLKNGTLEAKYTYTLRVKAAPMDYARNKADIVGEEYSFDGTDAKTGDNYIAGIKFLKGNSIKVKLCAELDAEEKLSVELKKSGKNIVDNTLGKAPAVDINGDGLSTVIINTTEPLRKDISYSLSINKNSFSFKGIVEDDVSLEAAYSSGTYIFTYKNISVNDIVKAEIYGISSAGQLEGKDTKEIKTADIAEAKFELSAADKLILKADAISDDGDIICTYEDAALKNIVDAVLKAYSAKTADNSAEENINSADDLEETAVKLIKEYEGISREELLKLLNSDGDRLN